MKNTTKQGYSYLIESVIFVLIIIAYAVTNAPGLTSEDSGSFHMALINFGVNHPPGYPLYTIIGHYFMQLGSFFWAFSLAKMVNLFSMFWAICSIGTIWTIIRCLNIGRVAAIIATLGAAFSFTFWSQANVAEVYTMNVFLVLISILFIVLLVNSMHLSTLSSKRDIYGCILSLLFGLGLAHHYPLYIMSILPIIITSFFIIQKNDLKGFFFRHYLWIFISLLLLGLTPYLYLFYRALISDSVYQFSHIDSVKDVFDHISRKQYAPVKSTIYDKLAFLKYISQLVVENFRGLTILIAVGLFTTFKTKWRYFWPFFFSILGPTVGLVILVSAKASPLNFAVFRVYPVGAFFVMCIFAAFAVDYFWKKSKESNVGRTLLVLFMVVIVGEQFSVNYSKASHQNNNSIRRYAQAYLMSLPPKSVLVLCGDIGFSLYYAQQILGIRKDLYMVDDDGLYTKETLYKNKQKENIDLNTKIRIKKKFYTKWLQEGKPIIATCKTFYQQIGMQSTSRIFGHETRQSSGHKRYPQEFDHNFFGPQFLNEILTEFPKQDGWNDNTVMNAVTRLFVYASLKGVNPLTHYDKIISALKVKNNTSNVLFNEPETFIKQLANDLLSFGNYKHALDLYDRLSTLVAVKDWTFHDKLNYCQLLVQHNRNNDGLKYCTQASSKKCSIQALKMLEILYRRINDTQGIISSQQALKACKMLTSGRSGSNE